MEEILEFLIQQLYLVLLVIVSVLLMEVSTLIFQTGKVI